MLRTCTYRFAHSLRDKTRCLPQTRHDNKSSLTSAKNLLTTLILFPSANLTSSIYANQKPSTSRYDLPSLESSKSFTPKLEFNCAKRSNVSAQRPQLIPTMARANLIIADDLKDAFKSACQKHQPTPVRWIKASLADVTISWVNSFPSSSGISATMSTSTSTSQRSTRSPLPFLFRRHSGRHRQCKGSSRGRNALLLALLRYCGGVDKAMGAGDVRPGGLQGNGL